MHPIARTLALTALCLGLCAGLALHEQGAQAAHAASAAYIGNPKSGIYHNSRCKYFTCKACTVPLVSPQEAQAKGFRACKVCGG